MLKSSYNEVDKMDKILRKCRASTSCGRHCVVCARPGHGEMSRHCWECTPAGGRVGGVGSSDSSFLWGLVSYVGTYARGGDSENAGCVGFLFILKTRYEVMNQCAVNICLGANLPIKRIFLLSELLIKRWVENRWPKRGSDSSGHVPDVHSVQDSILSASGRLLVFRTVRSVG